MEEKKNGNATKKDKTEKGYTKICLTRALLTAGGSSQHVPWDPVLAKLVTLEKEMGHFWGHDQSDTPSLQIFPFRWGWRAGNKPARR